VFSKDFLSQTYIDTTIQTAYYGFIAANKEAGGSTQVAAIQKAKSVVAELKKLAEDDPNKRYILFRLSELEAQIGLEEEEVSLKKRYAAVIEINKLVEIFNKELLQERPNFANLHTLHARMSAIDISKSNQFADLINQKNKSVTFNLKQAFNNALVDNDYVKAENIYHYFVENRKYINVSNADIEIWRKGIQAKKDADYLKANIDNRIVFINGIVAQNRLSEARRHIEVLSGDLTGARALLTQSFISSSKMKLDNLSANINRREDSLVQYGYRLVSDKKYKEATTFLNSVLFPAGVNRDKTAGIDRAIIEEGGGSRTTTYNSTLSFENVSEEGAVAMNNEMKQRVKSKTDSIRLVNEAEDFKALRYFEKKSKGEIDKYTKNILNRSKIRRQYDDFLFQISQMFAQGKGSAAVKKFRSKQSLCFANATPKTYYDVKIMVNAQTGSNNMNDGELTAMMQKHREENFPEAKREKADRIVSEINDLVKNQNASSAYAMFYFNKSLLDQYISPDSLNKTKRTLVKAYIKETGI
jgi:hypothetical protein